MIVSTSRSPRVRPVFTSVPTISRSRSRDGSPHRYFLIGASVGSPEEAHSAGEADYWGVGPWRATGTKSDAGAALGSDGFGRLVELAGGRPCISIGGVRPEDVLLVLAAGGAGVAVVSGIIGDTDPEAATRRYALAGAMSA